MCGKDKQQLFTKKKINRGLFSLDSNSLFIFLEFLSTAYKHHPPTLQSFKIEMSSQGLDDDAADDYQ